MSKDPQEQRGRGRFLNWTRRKPANKTRSPSTSSTEVQSTQERPAKWSFGVLNDRVTNEVPGSILLLPKGTDHNEPLGLQTAPARTSASSIPAGIRSPLSPRSSRPSSRPGSRGRRLFHLEKKRTKDGRIILEPQPDDSLNDPLNWPSWRRDVALLSLGFYCMVGGGMTPILAAAYQPVADTYHIEESKVALTTGFYQLGLGLGSVLASPTAILYGKRPVYLFCIIVLLLSAIWCALSPTYMSLVIARVFMGFTVSPVECLPSATIAEIFFLHERAYRLGIYTLLLLSGKNLVPLVAAAIVESLDWRWIFWIVALVVGFCFVLIFLFVPETFWDRTPLPHHNKHHLKNALESLSRIFHHENAEKSGDVANEHGSDGATDMRKFAILSNSPAATPPQTAADSKETLAERRLRKLPGHIEFSDAASGLSSGTTTPRLNLPGSNYADHRSVSFQVQESRYDGKRSELKPNMAQADAHSAHPGSQVPTPRSSAFHSESWRVQPQGEGPVTPALHNLDSPYYHGRSVEGADYIHQASANQIHTEPNDRPSVQDEKFEKTGLDPEKGSGSGIRVTSETRPDPIRYTSHLKTRPPKTFRETLKPWNGRLRSDEWLKVAVRPFILFAYPAILWSALVYSLSIGWLVVLSESVSEVYRNRDSYNFSALGTGLVYVSPFIGGVMGTALAGKVSDVIVRWMSRRNGGVYEPEFRLVMAIPVAISTGIGLIGFGWSASEKDLWIVPTVFFGIISFGCSLGSTTAITFAVDSYRQYAGEALVTLNFSKNVFHGLAFSLFFPGWLVADGPKSVFLVIGIIQVVCMFTAIPMFIYGKRARMWTVRKNLMEKF
ncbi:hypothetical protein MMC25_003165 [Agyrium rufum]|nr:hypothetical protein [Agyrium rufum]